MQFVTRRDVKKRIDEIGINSFDDERAHSMEDKLREDVLFTISRNTLSGKDASLLALEALRTGAIDFKRWCA